MSSIEAELHALIDEDDEGDAMMKVRVLSADAPEFVPMPHVVSVLHSESYITQTMKCDLTKLTVGELRQFSEQHFGPSPYSLLLSGQPITRDPSAKAIDLGLGNGAVLVLRADQASTPPSGTATPTRMGSFTPKGCDSSPEMTPEKMTPANLRMREYCDMWTRVYHDFLETATDSTQYKLVIHIMEVGAPEHQVQLLQLACTHFIELARTIPGCEVLMSFMAVVGEDAGITLLEAMLPHVVELANTMPGRKIMQNAAVKYRDDVKKWLYVNICNNLKAIALDQCGCITIQRMYDVALAGQLKEMLQSSIIASCSALICDQYGNYVVQHIIKDNKLVSEKVVCSLCRDIVRCATNKFGSNVIEKCLKQGSDNAKAELVVSLCNRETIEVLVKDQYGNYVIQTAVENSPIHLVEVLSNHIVPVVQSSPYSYKIESKLQRRLKQTTVHPALSLFPPSPARVHGISNVP